MATQLLIVGSLRISNDCGLGMCLIGVWGVGNLPEHGFMHLENTGINKTCTRPGNVSWSGNARACGRVREICICLEGYFARKEHLNEITLKLSIRQPENPVFDTNRTMQLIAKVIWLAFRIMLFEKVAHGAAPPITCHGNASTLDCSRRTSNDPHLAEGQTRGESELKLLVKRNSRPSGADQRVHGRDVLPAGIAKTLDKRKEGWRTMPAFVRNMWVVWMGGPWGTPGLSRYESLERFCPAKTHTICFLFLAVVGFGLFDRSEQTTLSQARPWLVEAIRGSGYASRFATSCSNAGGGRRPADQLIFQYQESRRADKQIPSPSPGLGAHHSLDSFATRARPLESDWFRRKLIHFPSAPVLHRS
ncbi:uncharacterized protein CIMG_13264 [Coccidioides immitis RS]|uniref:Uncharacterized protein n=1 Tax=Coccidioides immitis (strain RS) TaxID=246410 RepID=J3K4W0_COCIM|nr:uncharacterized protein CIMG_13264 [Coccidioides immitis RS]EAS29382.3 hypothetical protein CIMG_13264 [Coccidioides immitis RS]